MKASIRRHLSLTALGALLISCGQPAGQLGASGSADRDRTGLPGSVPFSAEDAVADKLKALASEPPAPPAATRTGYVDEYDAAATAPVSPASFKATSSVTRVVGKNAVVVYVGRYGGESPKAGRAAALVEFNSAVGSRFAWFDLVDKCGGGVNIQLNKSSLSDPLNALRLDCGDRVLDIAVAADGTLSVVP